MHASFVMDYIVCSTKFSCLFGRAFVDTFVDTCVDMCVDMFARRSRVASAVMCANAFHDTRFSGVDECLGKCADKIAMLRPCGLAESIASRS